jgi:prepilin-type N-terminal cleavage/methylation domain-containing protein
MKKRAFTLIELLVVIAIIAILAAILFPVFAQAKAAAKATQSLSGMKQIGTAFQMYLTDYDDLYAPRRVTYEWAGVPDGFCGTKRAELSWKQLTFPYIKNIQLFNDPVNPKAKYPDDASDPALRASWGQYIPAGTPLLGRGYAFADIPWLHKRAWSSTPCFDGTFSPNNVENVANTLAIAEHKRAWVDTGPYLDWNRDDWDPITTTIGDWPWGGKKWDDNAMVLIYHDGHAKRAGMRAICGRNDELNMWGYQRNQLNAWGSMGDVQWLDTFCTAMPQSIR